MKVENNKVKWIGVWLIMKGMGLIKMMKGNKEDKGEGKI